jgi:hypothetical protein
MSELDVGRRDHVNIGSRLTDANIGQLTDAALWSDKNAPHRGVATGVGAVHVGGGM